MSLKTEEDPGPQLRPGIVKLVNVFKRQRQKEILEVMDMFMVQIQ